MKSIKKILVGIAFLIIGNALFIAGSMCNNMLITIGIVIFVMSFILILVGYLSDDE